MSEQTIQVPDLGQVLTKRLSMVGARAPAGELSPEVSAVLCLENDRVEWGFLRQQIFCGALGSMNGVAAQTCNARIRNPANSGVLARVLAANVAVLAASTVQAYRGVAVTDFTTPMNANALDSRATQGACIVSAQNAGAASGTKVEETNIGISTPYLYITSPWVTLAPGGSYDLANATVNVGSYFSFVWFERPVQPTEIAAR